jgi:hypothetical protein
VVAVISAEQADRPFIEQTKQPVIVGAAKAVQKPPGDEM